MNMHLFLVTSQHFAVEILEISAAQSDLILVLCVLFLLYTERPFTESGQCHDLFLD